MKISASSVIPVKISEINRRYRALGTKTIVQYVESAESLDQLREMKIDFAQGLHLSPGIGRDLRHRREQIIHHGLHASEMLLGSLDTTFLFG